MEKLVTMGGMRTLRTRVYCTNPDFNSTNKQQPASQQTNHHVIGSQSLPYCAYLLRYSSTLEILGVFKIRPKVAASALLDPMYFNMHSTTFKHSAVPGAQVSLSNCPRWLDRPNDYPERERSGLCPSQSGESVTGESVPSPKISVGGVFRCTFHITHM